MMESSTAPPGARRERRLVAAGLIVIVVVRSAVFVFSPQSHFDSDQAVTGLMATHLSELRAFPVFWYGQSYLLAVEAWLAAPIFRLAGASATALKLPLLAMNVAIVLLLARVLTRDAGLRPATTGFATLFFALTAPITTALLLTANGGNVEPALYVLLLWVLRNRPVWAGLVLGVGFLNREFTIYGLLALLTIDTLRGTLVTRAALRRFGVMFATAALLWVAAQVARQYSSAAGPGTSVADLYALSPENNVLELLRRVCVDFGALGHGFRQLFAAHYPQLLGTAPAALVDLGIESRVHQGLPIVTVCLALLVVIAALRIAARLVLERRWRDEYTPCAYLLLVACFSSIGYLIGRCGDVNFYTMRYELLSVLGLVGLSAWYFTIERSRSIRRVWITLAALVLATSAVAHVKLLAEYLTAPPTPAKRLLIRQLEARGVRYGYAGFWDAYYVTFMTHERVQLAADDAIRIRYYNRVVDDHRREAVRVSRHACAGGERITPAFWLCAP